MSASLSSWPAVTLRQSKGVLWLGGNFQNSAPCHNAAAGENGAAHPCTWASASQERCCKGAGHPSAPGGPGLATSGRAASSCVVLNALRVQPFGVGVAARLCSSTSQLVA